MLIVAVNGGYQWKLSGRPWVGSVAPVGGFGLTATNTPGNENDTARHLITVIMSMLAGRGWQLVAAADVCSIYAGVVVCIVCSCKILLNVTGRYECQSNAYIQ
jgi:hypothetical protein